MLLRKPAGSEETDDWHRLGELHDSQDTGDSRLNTKPMMGSAGRAVASELGIIHCARITRTEIEHLEHAITAVYA